jgi:hypothetical protein
VEVLVVDFDNLREEADTDEKMLAYHDLDGLVAMISVMDPDAINDSDLHEIQKLVNKIKED